MEIDINTLRSLATLLGFIAFIGIVRYAYHSQRKAHFSAIAEEILHDREP